MQLGPSKSATDTAEPPILYGTPGDDAIVMHQDVLAITTSIRMKLINPLLVVILALIASMSSCTQPPVLEHIYLVQVGPNLPPGKMELVKRQLQESYQVPVQTLPPVALPESAFYAPRNRYRARVILNQLRAMNLPVNSRHDKLLALTVEDVEVRISPQKPHWGVMGLADRIGGQQAVISLYRMAGKDSRLRNVAVHETGHLLGLRHCSGPENNRCVMRDAKGSGATVDRCSLDFCATCSQKKEM